MGTRLVSRRIIVDNQDSIFGHPRAPLLNEDIKKVKENFKVTLKNGRYFQSYTQIFEAGHRAQSHRP